MLFEFILIIYFLFVLLIFEFVLTLIQMMFIVCAATKDWWRHRKGYSKVTNEPTHEQLRDVVH